MNSQIMKNDIQQGVIKSKSIKEFFFHAKYYTCELVNKLIIPTVDGNGDEWKPLSEKCA